MSELEETTLYEGGYHKETQVIKNFWDFAHALPRVSQQKLLQFTTGSDRVPVGGLGKLKLTITRNGSDSDRYTLNKTWYHNISFLYILNSNIAFVIQAAYRTYLFQHLIAT